MKQIEIQTADGPCRAFVFQPASGQGPWPGVILYMDALGVRPAMHEIAEKLANYGYCVLMPDIFWRVGAYEPVVPRVVFAGDMETRRKVFGPRMAAAAPALVMADTRAFIDCLRALPQVKRGGIGMVGYCMGGTLALTAAGTYGDDIAAAASYHGSRLATDAPDSPHRLAPKIKARLYIAGATGDDLFPDEQKARLEQALRDAGVAHRIETYAAAHGWVPTDMPAHDAAAAERHWRTLTAFYAETLGI